MIAAILSILAALPPGQLPKLQYYGGRVVSNVKVVPVLWGPNVDSSGKFEDFYKAIVQGPVYDWLDQDYSTSIPSVSGAQGTGQRILPGDPSNIQTKTIVPNIVTGTISEDEIVAELTRQIAKAVLPAPDPDTVYMVHFPPKTTITAGVDVSCQPRSFCAFHDTIDIGRSSPLLIGVIPDHGPGSGCETGCGDSSIPFQNVTNSASHELMEIVTDPNVGLRNADNPFSPPVAWIDPLPPDVDTDHSEIGDICAGPGDAAWEPGGTYVVQKEWSNQYNACIASGNDAFRLLPVSTTLKIANADTPVQFNLQTSAPRTGTPTLTFSVPNRPTGVTLAPATVIAGGQATLSIKVAKGSSLPTTMLVNAASPSVDAKVLDSPQAIAFALVSLRADDFTLAGPSQAFPVPAGGQQTVQLSTGVPVDSDPVQIDFTASARDGVSGTFSPAALTSGGSTSATIKVDHGTPSGATPVTITATTGLVTHNSVVLLNVDGDDFSISVNPPTAAVLRGGSATVVLKTQTPHGAAQGLTLSAQVPGGIGATFDPPQVQSGQESKLTLTTGDGASFGPAAVRIVAQGVHAAKEAQFSLGVGQPPGCSSAEDAPAVALLALLIFRRRR